MDLILLLAKTAFGFPVPLAMENIRWSKLNKDLRGF